jgi:hypothetical protein
VLVLINVRNFFLIRRGDMKCMQVHVPLQSAPLRQCMRRAPLPPSPLPSPPQPPTASPAAASSHRPLRTHHRRAITKAGAALRPRHGPSPPARQFFNSSTAVALKAAPPLPPCPPAALRLPLQALHRRGRALGGAAARAGGGGWGGGAAPPPRPPAPPRPASAPPRAGC